MFKNYFLFVVLLISENVLAQNEKTFSLTDCIEYALENNVTVKQSATTFQISEAQYAQSKFLKYPTLNGSFNSNANAGRNIDPFSNSVVTQTIGTNNLGLAASVPIYDGFKNRNTVARNELNMEAAQNDLLSQKNNLSLQVASNYLNVLTTEELVIVAQKQLDVSNMQLEKSQKLVKAGALSETALYDLEAQIANDELNLVNASNSNVLALLNLKQSMNMPTEVVLKVQKIVVPNPNLTSYADNANEIYHTAISFLPEIKAGELRIAAANKNIAIARSVGLPYASIASSWGSAYSSIAKNLTSGEIQYQTLPASAIIQGQNVPFNINIPTQTYIKNAIPYLRQIGNNQNLNLGLALRVPIFNAYNQKYQVQISKIQKLQSDLQNESTKLGIKQNIDQAFITMLNSHKKYEATQAQVLALEKAFKATETKFNAGANNYIDYSVSKTNLDRAKANLIVAKYDYVFRVKILDFYQNKGL